MLNEKLLQSVQEEHPLQENELVALSELKQRESLRSSENYVSKIVYVNQGISMLVETILYSVMAVHLKNLNASSHMIGITFFLARIGSMIRTTVFTYLANYVPNDITVTLRSFLCMVALGLMGYLTSIIGLLSCFTAYSMLEIQMTTSLCVISKLLPQEQSTKYSQIALGLSVIIVILGSVLAAAIVAFTSISHLFYVCAAFCFLSFMFDVVFVLGRESKLIANQMQFFDEAFYVERKSREIKDGSCKYRRRSSLGRSIQLYFAKKPDYTNYKLISHEIDFPIYDEKARQIIQKKEELEAEGQALNANVVLSKVEWTLIVFIGFFFCIGQFITDTVAAWGLLYLTTKFPNKSSSLSLIMVTVATVGSLLSMLLYPFKFKIVKKMLSYDPEHCNSKQEITANCCLPLFALIPAVLLFLWVRFIHYYNVGWIVLFCFGYFLGVSMVIPYLVMPLLKTEQLQSKILAVIFTISNMVGASAGLLIGFLWNISIDYVWYLISLSLFLIFSISICMIFISTKLNRR